MKKHSTVKVVLITLLVFMLLTWIIPAASFQSSYQDQGLVQMGIFDLFSYPVTALSYFGYIAIFMLVVGGFYGILYKIPAYRKLLDNISKSLKKKGKLTIAIMMILIAVLTSICGLQLGLFIFVPFLISIILLMGYDKIVAALTIVGSSMIGIAGTTYSYTNTSVIISLLGTKLTTNILVKVLILVLALAVLIINTILYINKLEKQKPKTKKTVKTTKTAKTTKTTKSTKTTKAAAKKEEVKEVKTADQYSEFLPAETSTKDSVMPLAIVFGIMFVLIVLAFISWSYGFGTTAFEDATKSVVDYKVFGFKIFGKLLGNVKSFGTWTLSELVTLMIVFAGLLMIIYKVKFQEGLEAFANGAKKALEPAVLVILIYACLVAVTYHPFQLTIYHFLFGFTKGFNLFTNIISSILASLFNSDPLYSFQSVLPYLQSIVSSKSAYGIISVMYPAFYGITMLIAPTSLVLMSVLSYLGVSYKEWLKNVWKLLLELFVLLLIIVIIAYLVLV